MYCDTTLCTLRHNIVFILFFMLILLIKSFLVIFVLVCLVLYFSIDIINLTISEKTVSLQCLIEIPTGYENNRN